MLDWEYCSNLGVGYLERGSMLSFYKAKPRKKYGHIHMIHQYLTFLELV